MYQVALLPQFKKQLRPLTKSYPSIKNAWIQFCMQPEQCKPVQDGMYKARVEVDRLTTTSVSGFWMDVFLIVRDDVLIPVAMNHRAMQENMSRKDLNRALEATLYEIDRTGHTWQTT